MKILVAQVLVVVFKQVFFEESSLLSSKECCNTDLKKTWWLVARRGKVESCSFPLACVNLSKTLFSVPTRKIVVETGLTNVPEFLLVCLVGLSVKNPTSCTICYGVRDHDTRPLCLNVYSRMILIAITCCNK